MFGMAKVPFFESPDTGFTGPQIRGFGFTNEGSPDTIFTFFNSVVFRSTVTAGFPLLGGDQTRRDVEQFMLAFDSDLAPIVGQQVSDQPECRRRRPAHRAARAAGRNALYFKDSRRHGDGVRPRSQCRAGRHGEELSLSPEFRRVRAGRRVGPAFGQRAASAGRGGGAGGHVQLRATRFRRAHRVQQIEVRSALNDAGSPARNILAAGHRRFAEGILVP